MTKWLILLSMLATAMASAAPAWRWVDADGTIHYSDRPVPGAEEVNLPDGRGFASPAAAAADASPAAPNEPAAAPVLPYQLFDIASPTQMETLWNLGGTMTVQVTMSPDLQPGHSLDLVLDGAAQQLGATSTSLQLTNLARGLHTILAFVYDANGTEMGRSAPVQFVVQQTSIQNPNNPGNSRRAN